MDELYFLENSYIFKNSILNEAIISSTPLNDLVDKFGEYISVENNAKNFIKKLLSIKLDEITYQQYNDKWTEFKCITDLSIYDITSSEFTKNTYELLNFVNEVNSRNILNPIIAKVNELLPEVLNEIKKYISINFSDLKLKLDVTLNTIFSDKTYESLDAVINALFDEPNKDMAAQAIFNLYVHYEKFEKFNELVSILYCKNK